jgi:hypothetical protein
MIEQHINEYQRQIEQHQQAIIALTGAIQALERIQKEQDEPAEKEADNGK